MSENTKLVPKRRFKEFQTAGEWEQRKLGQLATLAKGQGYSKNDLCEQGTPVILYGRLYTKYQTTIDEVDTFTTAKSGSVYSTGNEVVVPASGETAEDISRAAAIVKSGFLLGGDLNIVYPNENLEPTFLALSISNGEQQKSLSKKAQGKSVVHLHNTDLEGVEISYPKRAEQEQISRYFCNFDNLITLHQRKLEKMKALKSAYLSEMFPAEGEREPKRRFAGFTGAWEQRKLGELSSLITKGTTPLDKSGSGNINFIKIENINPSSNEIVSTAKITIEEHNGYLKRSHLQENDILFSIAGTLGRVAVVNKDILPANTNQALAIIRLKNGCLRYITTYLKGKAVSEYIKKNPTIGAQPNLSLEQVGNLEIELPKDEEQFRIGQFFQNLDNLITLHHRKLEKLQNIKQAYLNEMFL